VECITADSRSDKKWQRLVKDPLPHLSRKKKKKKFPIKDEKLANATNVSA
jgi:hypothetical protein